MGGAAFSGFRIPGHFLGAIFMIHSEKYYILDNKIQNRKYF